MKTKVFLMGVETRTDEKNGSVYYVPVLDVAPLSLPELLDLYKALSSDGTIEVNIQ